MEQPISLFFLFFFFTAQHKCQHVFKETILTWKYLTFFHVCKPGSYCLGKKWIGTQTEGVSISVT